VPSLRVSDRLLPGDGRGGEGMRNRGGDKLSQPTCAELSRRFKPGAGRGLGTGKYVQ
jgi:hypothetical protein